MALFDNNGYYTNDNLMHLQLWCDEILKFQKPEKKWEVIMNSAIDLKYILAIINSKLNTYFFSKYLSTDTLQGTYSSIYPEDIRQIPIKLIDKAEQESITSLVEQILRIKQGDAGANTSGLEAEIDVLVYRLYNLTYDEVLLVDPAFALTRQIYEQSLSPVV